MTIDTEKLEEVAQAATPGPWTITQRKAAYMVWAGGSAVTRKIGDVSLNPPEAAANASFLTTFNPAVALALLERLRRAESLREIAQRVETEHPNYGNPHNTTACPKHECAVRGLRKGEVPA